MYAQKLVENCRLWRVQDLTWNYQKDFPLCRCVIDELFNKKLNVIYNNKQCTCE